MTLSERYQSEDPSPAPLAKPLHFEFSGRTAKNRFLKAAMSELLSSWSPTDLHARGIPTPNLVNVYRRWGEGGYGQIVTGNIMIECLLNTKEQWDKTELSGSVKIFGDQKPAIATFHRPENVELSVQVSIAVVSAQHGGGFGIYRRSGGQLLRVACPHRREAVEFPDGSGSSRRGGFVFGKRQRLEFPEQANHVDHQAGRRAQAGARRGIRL